MLRVQFAASASLAVERARDDGRRGLHAELESFARRGICGTGTLGIPLAGEGIAVAERNTDQSCPASCGKVTALTRSLPARSRVFGRHPSSTNELMNGRARCSGSLRAVVEFTLEGKSIDVDPVADDEAKRAFVALTDDAYLPGLLALVELRYAGQRSEHDGLTARHGQKKVQRSLGLARLS